MRLYCIAYIARFSGVVGAMVNRDSLQKRAASQSIHPPQVTKRNTITPLHVGLRTVLACCPPLPLSSSTEEDKEDKEDKEEEGGEEVEEAQESDEDFNQGKDNKDKDN